MRPIVVKSSIYFEYDVESNDKNPELEVGGHARILKYKIICTKVTLQIGQIKPLLSKNIYILYRGHMK